MPLCIIGYVFGGHLTKHVFHIGATSNTVAVGKFGDLSVVLFHDLAIVPTTAKRLVIRA